MTRTALNPLDPIPQYFSLVYQKIPGESDWTLLHQIRAFNPKSQADERKIRRVGDKNETVLGGVISHTGTIEVYGQQRMEEVARALGFVKPGGGWAGTEVVELEPTFAADYKVVNFTGEDADATITSIEYFNRFKPTSFQGDLNPDIDARVFVITGNAAAWYIEPEAG